MQTFLPYPDFRESLESLDYKRLGKQRVEAWQIYQIVSGKRTKGGWINQKITDGEIIPALRCGETIHRL